jgi:phosphoglycolate phosphatase-like HAD superfamily hydrolase/ADP-ribose pyrophosphatase YjhB (NUDIX family)
VAVNYTAGVIRNIIFDWSGTLVDDLPAVLEATNHVLAQAKRPEMTLEEFRSEFCLPFTTFYDKHTPDIPLQQLEEWFHSRFGQVQESVCALPHAESFLRFCAAQEVRTFLLSTVSQRYFETQAGATGFGKYIQTPYVNVWDKRRKIREILETHQLHPEETLFIGDMEHDIETAREGGIHSCAVLTGYNTLDQLRLADPDLIVEHLGELQDLLEQNHMQLQRPAKGFLDRHRPIVTVGALIFSEAGEVLMVRTHKWSNLWGIPGGKVRWGESSTDALSREVREETGLEIGSIRFELVQDCIHSKEFYRETHFILLNYSCRAVGEPVVVLNEEAQEFQWVTLAQAQKLPLNHPTRVLLAHVVTRQQDESLADTAREVFY